MGTNDALGRSHVRAKPSAFCKPVSPAVLVLLLALRLGRAKEYELTELGDGLDASSPFDPLKAGLPAGAHDVAVYDACGMFDEPRDNRMNQRNVSAKSGLETSLEGPDEPPPAL